MNLNINNFPVELYNKILEVEPKELCRFSQTSKKFKKIAKEQWNSEEMDTIRNRTLIAECYISKMEKYKANGTKEVLVDTFPEIAALKTPEELNKTSNEISELYLKNIPMFVAKNHSLAALKGISNLPTIQGAVIDKYINNIQPEIATKLREFQS